MSIRSIAFAALLLPCIAVAATAGDMPAAMDFEASGAWLTAPDLLDEFREDELWSSRTIPYADLAGGVTLSGELVKSGNTSGRWGNHPLYPTIHCRQVPADWSGANSLAFWAHSETATAELITLAVLSDSAQTEWKDYYLYTFKVDWTGWKYLVLPLADFEAYEQPSGWSRVGAVFFFTKIFDRQPNPYTLLHLDDMRLTADARATVAPAEPRREAEGGRIPVNSDVPWFDPSVMNHSWPETLNDATISTPIQYASYFRGERALYGYYPRFEPGFVSFSPQGKAYLQYGSHVIETMGEDGAWHYRDILWDVLEPYAREKLGFRALSIHNHGQTNEAGIRFDNGGDAYMICYVSDPTGDWRTRKGLLLHSRDSMRTWSVYLLPNYMARFEEFAGHNGECFDGPPVILLSTYFSPTNTFITIPRKQPDGTLVIPPPVQVADKAIAFIPHSGEANNAISHEGKVYLAYGRMVSPDGKTKGDGVPAYVRTYDRATGQLSEPVLVGFGGINVEDDHNWPAIAADSQGILHVVINGHHNHFAYTHSLRPWDIGEWSEPEKVAAGTSYAGLVIDSQDTLHTVTRNSDPGYYFKLSLHRKKPGQPWEPPKHLVLPFKPYYVVYYHKLVIDPQTDRLALAYYAQSLAQCVFKDEYLAHLYIWPHREKRFLQGSQDPSVPLGTYKQEPRKYQFYSGAAQETAILLSDDRGETWRLAVSGDFRN